MRVVCLKCIQSDTSLKGKQKWNDFNLCCCTKYFFQKHKSCLPNYRFSVDQFFSCGKIVTWTFSATWVWKRKFSENDKWKRTFFVLSYRKTFLANSILPFSHSLLKKRTLLLENPSYLFTPFKICRILKIFSFKIYIIFIKSIQLRKILLSKTIFFLNYPYSKLFFRTH